MSLNIDFSTRSSLASPEPIHRLSPPKRLGCDRECLSEATCAIRVHLKSRYFYEIGSQKMADFIERLISNLDESKHPTEIAELKQLLSRPEHLENGDYNPFLVRLYILNEKNPIFAALRSLSLGVIDNLKSAIPTPAFFHNFFEKLEFHATLHHSDEILTFESSASQPTQPIKELIKLANNLLNYKDKTKALKTLNITIKTIYHSMMIARERVDALRTVTALFFQAEEKEAGLAALRKAWEFIRDITSIEELLEGLEGLAIDFFTLGEEKETIDLINLIIQTSYFSQHDRISTFEKIFEFMLDNDIDLMLSIIAKTDSSIAKDIVIKELSALLLEDTESKEDLSQAFQLAKCIQNEELRADALRKLPKGKEESSELEA